MVLDIPWFSIWLGVRIIVFLLIALIVFYVFKKCKDYLAPTARTVHEVKEILENLNEDEYVPEVRSISGATSIYKPKIEEDFPDYHFPEAEAAVTEFIQEYLSIRYEGEQWFRKSRVEEGLEKVVEKADYIASVSDVAVHKVTIASYVKSKEYATIRYQVSVGYNLNTARIEERYQVESTLKFIENGYAANYLICEHCGGQISSTKDAKCPYCGSAIVWDTRMTWRFTSVKSY